MVTHEVCESNHKVILWNVKKETKIVSFLEAKSPVFTLDGQFLLYIDAGVNIIVYSLKNMAPLKCHSLPSCDALTCLPVKHHSVLVTTYAQHDSTVVLWDFHGAGKSKLRMCGVAKSGFCDVSKNGIYAVDEKLQVFSLESGDVVTCFRNAEASSGASKVTLVRLTYDGKYCFWFDEPTCLMQVGRVADAGVVAQVNVHEQLTTLVSMDYGYVMFAGRKDGHVIIMKLLPNHIRNDYTPKNEVDRRNYLLDVDTCSRADVGRFDSLFQASSQTLHDSEINTDCRNIVCKLSKDAQLPRLFTFLKTSDHRFNSVSSSVEKNLNHPPKSPSLPKRLLDSSMGRNANSLPRKRLNSKIDIQLVNSSNVSLASQSSHSSQSSFLETKNSQKSQSENHLEAINGKMSKLSLDSLIGGEEEEKKKKLKAFPGSQSMKMSIARPRSKFMSLFSHKEKTGN